MVANAWSLAGDRAAPQALDQDKKSTPLHLNYSSNLRGEISTCGCRHSPIGGLDRRWNAVHRLTFESAKAQSANAHEPTNTIQSQSSNTHRAGPIRTDPITTGAVRTTPALTTTVPANPALGAASPATAIAQLSLDSGDLFFKSAPAPSFLANEWITRAHAIAKAYRTLEIDATTPGEDDFAAGLTVYRELTHEAGVTPLAANIVDRKTKKPAFVRYMIKNKVGYRIAVFGLFDETLPLPIGLLATPHLTAARQLLSELSGKADAIIALTHIGLDKDRALAKALPRIDLIIGGHSGHVTPEPIQIGETRVLQAGSKGERLGQAEFLVTPEASGRRKDSRAARRASLVRHTLFRLDQSLDTAPNTQNPVAQIIEAVKVEEALLRAK